MKKLTISQKRQLENKDAKIDKITEQSTENLEKSENSNENIKQYKKDITENIKNKIKNYNTWSKEPKYNENNELIENVTCIHQNEIKYKSTDKIKVKYDILNKIKVKISNTNMNFMKSTAEGEKILFIERTCGDKKFQGMSPFFLKKVVDNAAGGTVVTAKMTREGKILVHTKDRKQAIKMMALNQIDKFKVKVQEDEKLNQSTGVIFCRDLKYSTDEEILEELEEQKVTGIKRMKKKNTEGQTYDTGVYFITFGVRDVPTELRVGYELLEVREYIPEPMRCYKCLKFGHIQKFCASNDEKKCGNCNQQVHTDREKGGKCLETPKCCNCGSNEHGSFSKICSVYKMEKEIAAIRVKMKISYSVARREYCKKNPLHTRTFARTTKEGTRPPEKPNENQLARTRVFGASGKPAPTPMEFNGSSSYESEEEINDPKKRSPPSPPGKNSKKKTKKEDQKTANKK